ncbi:hypothetical protein RRG08_055218 [Elysia crispata]|uniref:Uncharacterized protein n=1 Tax=Elysia crispata TaxID=231223 RepID=A0AAE0XSU0_9GAST|nr:hypothetical protein RRG08_055218 [Elysia crispata]
MATTPGTYNSTLSQDVELSSGYQNLGPNLLTSGDHGSCGPYSSVISRQMGHLRDTFIVPSPPDTNYVNVMSSVKGDFRTRDSRNRPLRK